MSWASGRRTTRIEDMAYCLLGIFDVNMPLLYGEGEKAFLRLQEEILRSSYDHSLFAWGLGPTTMSDIRFNRPAQYTNELYSKIASSPSGSSSKDPVEEPLLQGLLAGSPAEFLKSHDVESVDFWGEIHGTPPMIHNRCVHIDLPVISTLDDVKVSTLLLACRFRHDYLNYLGVALRNWGSGLYGGRLQELVLVPSEYLDIDEGGLSRNGTERMRIKAEIREEMIEGCFVIKRLPLESSGYRLGKAHCLPGAHVNRRRVVLKPKANIFGAQAILILYNAYGNLFAVLLAKIDQMEARHGNEFVLLRKEDPIPDATLRAQLYIRELRDRKDTTEEQLERSVKEKHNFGREQRISGDGTKVSG